MSTAMNTYTPAEAADRSGFSLDTLRYYEREGILTPIARTAGGRRAYSDDDLEWLGWVRCLRDTGMPISLIKQYADLAADPDTMRERLAILVEHEAAVTRSMEELRAQQRRLREKIAWYHGELGD